MAVRLCGETETTTIFGLDDPDRTASRSFSELNIAVNTFVD